MMNALVGCYNIIPIGDRVVLVKEGNVWSLPSGKLELGETLEQGAVREAKEESGLDVSPAEIVGIYQSPDLRGTNVINIAYVSEFDVDTFLEDDSLKSYTISEIEGLIARRVLRDNIHATMLRDYFVDVRSAKDIVKIVDPSW